MASLELEGFEDLEDAFKRISEIPFPVTAEALDGMAEVAMKNIKAQGESMGVRDPDSDVHIWTKSRPTRQNRRSPAAIKTSPSPAAAPGAAE